ncbi:TM1802 family CRISPR-associated protein, partial [Anoxybacillus flavithermus]|nr:TM1802 family CRISPR-associated protein [Anoxybacillus flavithermus]
MSKWIAKMEAAELIVTGNKKGSGKVRLDRFQLPDSLEGKSVILQKENQTICVGSQEFKYEAFVRAMLEHENKKDRFVLVIPAVFEQGIRIVLSQHEDYRTLVRKINNLELPNEREEALHSSEQRVCHVCQQLKPSVKSKYTTQFSRTGINKVFTTTTINSARYKADGYNYDDAYAICLECYRHLVNGEALIEKRFKGSIARESAFFLPEGLFEPFDYDSIGRIKDQLDFAFQCKAAEEWMKMVEADAEWMQRPYFAIHIIVYRTDGVSFTVLETIEDVPALRFMQVMKTVRQVSGQLKPFLRGMSLGNIYRMVPIRETKKGEQVDVGRVLSIYKALFSGHRIHSETLFNYAAEALDKGMQQLSKEKIDNYRNMGLEQYHPDKADLFIQRIAMQYLIFIQVLHQLAILDKPVFTPSFGTEERDMQSYDSVEAVEQFLDRQGFSSEARALFYLGGMIHRVGVEQYKKGHKTKPVLKKIHFQGMSASEVYRLYYDVLDKLRQY